MEFANTKKIAQVATKKEIWVAHGWQQSTKFVSL
jgi:hypothetical protein